MKKIIALLLLISFSVSYACDLDGDGLSELISYENETEWRWNYIRSSDDTLVTTTNPGSTDSLPAPGNYYGGNQDYLGVVNFNDFFWTALSPTDDEETVNFGFPDARSYIAGQDFNGDGVTDLAKFAGRCKRARRKCYNSRSLSGNFLLNATDGTNTFISSDVSTATGIFGRGLSALVTLDANSDGKDDICYTLPRRRRNPRQFRIICKDVVTGARVKRAKIGKLFGEPLAIKVAGVDYLILWRRSRRGVNLRMINFVNNLKTKARLAIKMDRRTTPLVAKWLPGNTEQIGFIVNGSELHIYNPLTEEVTIKTLPSGTPISCKNNFRSSTRSRILTTRNACRVFDCS